MMLQRERVVECHSSVAAHSRPFKRVRHAYALIHTLLSVTCTIRYHYDRMTLLLGLAFDHVDSRVLGVIAFLALYCLDRLERCLK